MINKISLKTNNYNYSTSVKSKQIKYNSSLQTAPNKFEQLPLYALQANFLPSFSGSKKGKKFETIEVIECETGNKVPLQVEVHENTIMNNTYFGNYKVKSGKSTAAFMDVDFEPETIAASENWCEIVHLRTLKGEQYKGLGTELIKMAIRKSFEHGKGGNIFLTAEKGYDWSSSPYHSNESPIPFYHKLGFKAFSEKDQKEIDRWVDKNPNMLPERVIMYLPSKKRDEYLKEMGLI